MEILDAGTPNNDGSDVNINVGNIGSEIPQNFTSNNDVDPELLQRFHVGIMMH